MINTKQIISGTQSLKLWLNGRQTRASGFETLLQNKLKNVICSFNREPRSNQILNVFISYLQQAP